MNCTRYHAWIKSEDGAVTHTTLRDDEWLSIDIDEIDVQAAIAEFGWCGCLGTISGSRIVLQDANDDTLCTAGVAYLRRW